MRYYVTIGDRTVEVDLTPDGATIDGETVSVDLRSVPDGPVRHLLIDGRSHIAIAERDAGRGTWRVHVNGVRLDADVIDERTRAIREMTGGGAAAGGPESVRAPMPGKVCRVDVEEGQAVAAGDGVISIEAMKMENELRAGADGVVARVLVELGEAVEKGAVLVEFEA